ncbi:hypothetical protein [Sphingomonas albertensis]|uniref:Uncharacterized protein n=1 Tax=Sphingomonas albertensis TaxID=2762591 RepID=A0ABR7AJK2_9SPHN|nr:hypothetical protein [Sphingomonas albertensis]MBC3940634.1 hypothetical protein [Sphingomonas albertensis]
MKLTVLSHGNEPRHAAEFARAARNMIEPDEAEVREFCNRLTGLKGETYMDVCDEVADLALPCGFLHARAFDADDGLELSSAISRTNRPLTPDAKRPRAIEEERTARGDACGHDTQQRGYGRSAVRKTTAPAATLQSVAHLQSTSGLCLSHIERIGSSCI